MIDELNSLHHKILHSSFAEEVTESEIQALVTAKKLSEQPQPYKKDHSGEVTEMVKEGAE